MSPPELTAEERVRFLAACEIFRDVEERALARLADEFRWTHLDAGETLLRQGDPGDSLYLIVSGRLQVVDTTTGLPERLISELGPGDPVGEIALWTHEKRSATVRAATPAYVAELSREQFDQIAAAHPSAAAVVDRVVARRFRRNQLSSALRISKLFGDLDEEALRDLEAEVELLWIDGGKTLFRQGDPGDALYLIVSGKLSVISEHAGEEPHLLAEAGRGATVGEMALIDGEPRSATVVAARDSQVAKLSIAGFERLAAGRRALFSILTRELVRRMREMTARVKVRTHAMTSVAVVSLSSSVSIDTFMQRLGAAFTALGSTICIDSAAFDRYAGRAGASQTSRASQTSQTEAGQGRVLDLLNHIEADHRFVIYQADPSLSPWTSRCLRDCDSVLLIADGDAKIIDALGVLAALPAQGGPTVSAVLLYRDSSAQPSGTRRRLSEFDPTRTRIGQHFHIRLDRDQDLGRLARSLSGNAFGLVFGGGGARGLAHSGLVRALEEANVPIDLVGGTSMGSYVAAGIGLGHTAKRMLELLVQNCAAVLKDKTIPIVSFLSGASTAQILLAQLGSIDIEDLWIPLFCVSANLTRARIEVHRDGPLAKSLLASSRVPGIFPPIVSGGDLLVDGGILNNVPVDVMRASPLCRYVIGSDVSPEVDMSGILDYGLSVSGWDALRNRFKPPSRRQPFPGILHVLLRTVQFGGTAYNRSHSEFADLYLRLPVGHFKTTDHTCGPEMAEVAYQYSKPKIAVWADSIGSILYGHSSHN